MAPSSLKAAEAGEPRGALVGALPQAVLEAFQDAVQVVSLDGRVVQANRRGLRALEAGGSQLGLPWSAQWPAATQGLVEAALSAARGGATRTFTAARPASSGAQAWWQATLSPVRGEGGRTDWLLAVCRDVTSSTEAEAFFNTICQLLPNPLLVKSALDGRYVLINRAAQEAFGLDATALGKNAFDLFPLREAQLFAEEDAAVVESRETHVSVNEPITLPSGEVRYFTTKKLATYDNDTPRHLVVICEDVTERRQARADLQTALAEAEAANQAKSAFLANISHEIRTPLNGVVGVADLLKRTPLSPEQLELVDIIKSCGDTLDRMLMDVLDVSKIEAGKLDLASEPFRLGELVRSVAGLMRPTAEAKGLTFACEVAFACEGSVIGDPVRLRQILTNLLSNAIKFTSKGSVTLSVKAAGRHHYRFAVRDSGIGFDEDARRRLFQRFEQADGTINRRFGGTGLGLSISRQLAELMGGEIDCSSTPGQGSEFTLLLPLADAAGPAESAPADGTGDVAAAVRVLVADDHATNRRVAQLALEAIGAEVWLAGDGAEALERLAAQSFDAVLMDMQMPGLDGLQATMALRRREAELSLPRTPVVMLTANTGEGHVEQALAAGADAHLAKPLKAASLLSMLSQLLAPNGAASGGDE